MVKNFKLWAGVAALLVAAGIWQLNSSQPTTSKLYQTWLQGAQKHDHGGAALLAFGDFGSLDLDTLETSAVPWRILATSLALREASGQADKVEMSQVVAALKRFGLLFPTQILDHPGLKPSDVIPFGMSIGVIERTFPPLQVTAMNMGCAVCHAGPQYLSDGTPNPSVAVLGRPNTALDLEAFSTESYLALKLAFRNEPAFFRALNRLFPDMAWREKLTLNWIVLPEIRERLSQLARTIDRPLPFNNGGPGLTNGVAALKYQLGVTPRDRYIDGAGFVSIPDLADRRFRSALLVDGAYAVKKSVRFHVITRKEAEARDGETLAAIASFFMVPSMGLTPERAAQAIPDLSKVIAYISRTRAPHFPGKVDLARASQGQAVYARYCASCHGTYDSNLSPPRLLSFPNWVGTVGTDSSRIDAFNAELKGAVEKTIHGKTYLDVEATGVVSAPLLSGIWASAPYFTNGSVPTLRHLLEPERRPARFMTGGHKLDLDLVGVSGVKSSNGVWVYPAGYVPYSKPALIDTSRIGYSNRGHEKEVNGLSADERTNLIEYLKLL